MFRKHFSGFYPGDEHQMLKIKSKSQETDEPPGPLPISIFFYLESGIFLKLLHILYGMISSPINPIRNSLKSHQLMATFLKYYLIKNTYLTYPLTQPLNSPLYPGACWSRHKYPADLHSAALKVPFKVTVREPFSSHNLGISTNHISAAKKTGNNYTVPVDFMWTYKSHYHVG